MQISNSIAYALGLNNHLTEAIALGHDLGHAPFGHSGEKELSEILKHHGLSGFKHNYQSLLIVNKLEYSHRNENGINLMYETKDGILRHTSLEDNISIEEYDAELDSERKNAITLEGQIVSMADEIAQKTHDTDDGLRSGRIALDKLVEDKLMKIILKHNEIKKPSLKKLYKENDTKARSRIIGAIIKYYVSKVISQTIINLNKYRIGRYEDILNRDINIVSLPQDIATKDAAFKEFLKRKFYDHHEIRRMDSRGAYFIKQLFKAFKRNPGQLPEPIFVEFKRNRRMRDCYKRGCIYKTSPSYIKNERKNGCVLQKDDLPACKAIRVIINYIAGMTDRHANLEYSRLYLPPEQ
jgi:dGTPase